MSKAKKLIPPDPKRCQAEITTTPSFMQLGGRVTTERCKNVPSTLATELGPGKDGQKGAMTVCDDCLKVMKRTVTGVTYTPLRKKYVLEIECDVAVDGSNVGGKQEQAIQDIGIVLEQILQTTTEGLLPTGDIKDLKGRVVARGRVE